MDENEIKAGVQALLDSFNAANAALAQLTAAMGTASEALELLAPYLEDLDEEVDY